MKRILALLLVLCMAFSLLACGKKTGTDGTKGSEPEQTWGTLSNEGDSGLVGGGEEDGEKITSNDDLIDPDKFGGKTLQLYANITPSNATNQNVTWTSSNQAAATIDADGLVTGVAPGKTTITATTVDGQFTAQTTITVEKAVPVTGVTVTDVNVNVCGIVRK